MDRQKFQYEGLKWLFELELLNHPQAINTIKFNILAVSKRVKEVELLIYRENKSMLVLVDLTWIGRTFSRRRIFEEIHEVLNQLLPTFRFRVTDDPRIMELAVERVKQALSGGKNENSNNPSNSATVQQPSDSQNSGTTSVEAVGTPVDPQPDQKEQPEAGSDVRAELSPDDSKKE